MILRFILAIVAFWAVGRLVRHFTQSYRKSRSDEATRIHRPRSKRRNPLKGGKVIDVEYTEKTSPRSGEGSSSG